VYWRPVELACWSSVIKIHFLTFMKLLGFSDSGKRLHFVRDLTEQEKEMHRKSLPTWTDARNKFHLFKLLGLNYSEWIAYINILLTPTMREEDIVVKLDRLLLNYLSCAYTIQEHFKGSIRRRFKNNTAKKEEYDTFIDELCKKSWEYAFFLDFRGYVQHCGLGIGKFNRQANLTSVTVSIGQDAKELLENSKEWKRCELTGKEGVLDLVKMLNEYHHRMTEQYGRFVAKLFYPELVQIANFYSDLTREVQQINLGFRMVFIENDPKINTEGDKQTMNLELSFVPNDLFAELGIMIPIK